MSVVIGKCELFNEDCMAVMARYPDKYFDLAIVDPPYGIGNFIPQYGKQKGGNFESVSWNDSIPDKDYFTELKRISENQIVWGANYYNCFDGVGGAIVWDKRQENPKLSRCEIASISSMKRVAYVDIAWAGFLGAQSRAGIHPCEKPVKLYEWLLTNYAKPGQRILDTHLGSGSHAIACNNLGFELTACELDTDYYNASIARIKQHYAQIRLFA